MGIWKSNEIQMEILTFQLRQLTRSIRSFDETINKYWKSIRNIYIYTFCARRLPTDHPPAGVGEATPSCGGGLKHISGLFVRLTFQNRTNIPQLCCGGSWVCTLCIPVCVLALSVALRPVCLFVLSVSLSLYPFLVSSLSLCLALSLP